MHLTIAEAPEKGSYRVTVSLDSLEALETGTPVTADSVAAARGTVWSGTLSAVGTLSPLQPDRSGTLTDELAGHLRLLFPALPQGGVREGMQWTDSTQYPLVSDAFTGTESSVTVYRAADTQEDERPRGDPAGDEQQVQPVGQAGSGRAGAGDGRHRHADRRSPARRRTGCWCRHRVPTPAR